MDNQNTGRLSPADFRWPFVNMITLLIIDNHPPIQCRVLGPLSGSHQLVPRALLCGIQELTLDWGSCHTKNGPFPGVKFISQLLMWI